MTPLFCLSCPCLCHALQVGFWTKRSVDQLLFSFRDVSNETVHPVLWLFASTFYLGLHLYLLYWIFAWGCIQQNAQVKIWGGIYGVCLIQVGSSTPCRQQQQQQQQQHICPLIHRYRYILLCHLLRACSLLVVMFVEKRLTDVSSLSP